MERAKARPASVIPFDCDAELKRHLNAFAKARTQWENDGKEPHPGLVHDLSSSPLARF